MKSLRFLLALAATAVAAFAQTGTAIPGGNQSGTYVITKPGRYYLAAHRVMTDPNKNAIEIASDDVTLDLNGHTVAFASNTGTGHGIFGKDLQNTEIRGGAVVSTPQNGIYIDSSNSAIPSSNTRVIDVRLSQIGSTGMRVSGNAVVIDRCSVDEVVDTGINTYWGDAVSILNCTINKTGYTGISTAGEGTQIKNCVVSNATKSGISSYARTAIEGCHVSNSNQQGGLIDGGIRTEGACTIRNNTVVGCKANGIFVAVGSALIEGNVIASIPTSSTAIGASLAWGSGLMMNNRYSNNGTLSSKLTNGGGNIAF